MFLIKVNTEPQKYVTSTLMFDESKKYAHRYNTRELAMQAIARAIKKHSSPEGMFSIIEDKKQPTGKYNSKRCWFKVDTQQIYMDQIENSIPFDSIFEARVYQVLISNYHDHTIALQYPLEIKPKTALYPQLDWKVDFYLYKHYEPKGGHLYIEAKGISQPEFIRNVQYFQFFNSREFENLIIVTEESRKIDKNLKSIGFRDFKNLCESGELIK